MEFKELIYYDFGSRPFSRKLGFWVVSRFWVRVRVKVRASTGVRVKGHG